LKAKIYLYINIFLIISLFLHLLLNNYLKSNYFINFLKYFILSIIIFIIILVISNFINVDYFIYCDGDDEITSSANQVNIVVESDNYYHIKKDSINVDKGMDIINQTLNKNFDKLVSNIGAATAAGSAASTILKTDLPPLQQISLAGASAAIVGASTKIGISVGEAIVKNNILNSGSDSKTPIENETPSPYTSFVSSVLDKSEIITPLEELLISQFLLNILILFLVIIFMVLLFNKLFINNKFINNFIRYRLLPPPIVMVMMPPPFGPMPTG